MLDDAFIVSSHTEGFFQVINLEENTVSDLASQPFGPVANTWGVEVFNMRPEGEPQVVFIPSTNGLYQCSVTPEGQFVYSMEVFYEGINVTNSVFINEDQMLISLQFDEDGDGDEEWNKLVILDLDTREELVVIAPEAAVNILDICRIPCADLEENPYFILHTSKGIQLVNSAKRKAYDLAQNA